MSEGIGILVGMVTNLERDFKVMNSKRLEGLVLIKDRAIMLIPLIHVSREEPTNSNDFALLDELLQRVQLVISSVEKDLLEIAKG